MPAIEVSITKNANKFVAVEDPVSLSKANEHSIDWHNHTQEQITIKFEAGTPFPAHLNPYVIDPGKSCHSGRIEGALGTFKYNIVGASGTITDPDVIIMG